MRTKTQKVKERGEKGKSREMAIGLLTRVGQTMDELLDDRVTERRRSRCEECGGIHLTNDELQIHHRNPRRK